MCIEVRVLLLLTVGASSAVANGRSSAVNKSKDSVGGVPLLSPSDTLCTCLFTVEHTLRYLSADETDTEPASEDQKDPRHGKTFSGHTSLSAAGKRSGHPATSFLTPAEALLAASATATATAAAVKDKMSSAARVSSLHRRYQWIESPGEVLLSLRERLQDLVSAAFSFLRDLKEEYPAADTLAPFLADHAAELTALLRVLGMWLADDDPFSWTRDGVETLPVLLAIPSGAVSAPASVTVAAVTGVAAALSDKRMAVDPLTYLVPALSQLVVEDEVRLCRCMSA